MFVLIFFIFFSFFQFSRSVSKPEFVPDILRGNLTINEPSTIISSDKNRNGLTVLSIAVHKNTARFQNGRNKKRPFWIDYSIRKDLILNFTRSTHGANSKCSLEILGTIPKVWIESSIAYLKNYNSNAAKQNNNVISRCIYMSGWLRREGLVAAATIRSVNFWCPIIQSHDSLCENVHNNDVELSLKMSTIKLKDYFTTKFKVRRLSAQYLKSKSGGSPTCALPQPEYPVLAVTTISYSNADLLVKLQLLAWIVHHARLGLKTVVYDREGKHQAFLSSELKHNYPDVLYANAGSMLDYRAYTIRDMLGFGDINQVHARADQDKALTYTFARFEYYARMQQCNHSDWTLGNIISKSEHNIKQARNVSTTLVKSPSTLVIDFDEFVLCSERTVEPKIKTFNDHDWFLGIESSSKIKSSSRKLSSTSISKSASASVSASELAQIKEKSRLKLNTRQQPHPNSKLHAPPIFSIMEQRKQLRSAILTSRASGKDEMVWGRFAVPNVSSIPFCLQQQYHHERSIFGCYGGWHFKNKHNTRKTMHHTLSCPNTDFHFACCSACPCGRKYQPTCSLIHLRPMHSYHYKGTEEPLQKVRRRYVDVFIHHNSSNNNKSNIHVNMDVEINDNLHVELADVWYDAMKQLDEAKANNIEAKTKSD